MQIKHGLLSFSLFSATLLASLLSSSLAAQNFSGSHAKSQTESHSRSEDGNSSESSSAINAGVKSGIEKPKKLEDQAFYEKKTRKTDKLGSAEEALAAVKKLCEENTSASRLETLVYSMGLENRFGAFYWSKERKKWWRKSKDAIFPENIIPRTRRHRESLVACEEVSFHAHYQVLTGKYGDADMESIYREAEASGSLAYSAGALLVGVLESRQLKAGEHQGVVTIQTDCKERPQAVREALGRVLACYEASEDLWVEYDKAQTQQDIESQSAFLAEARAKEKECDELAQRVRREHNVKETKYNLPPEGERIACQKL